MKNYLSARNVILGSTFVALLMLLGLANPSDTFAKAKADAKAHVSAQVEVDDDDNGSCLKAFGHLVSPGWIKKNGQPNIPDDCLLPPGIFKKIFGGGNGGGGGGNPNDTIAPVISNIDSSVEDDDAIITWSTNEKADSVVFYSTVSPVNINDAGTPRESDNDRVLSHEIELDDLAASTTYYAIVASKDASGNLATSSQFSFTTEADDGDDDDDDDIGPIIADIVIERGTTTASIAWSTDENADSAVFYATTSSIDVNDPEVDVVASAILDEDHDIDLSGLEASTTYYAVIRSRDADGNQTLSSEISFTTLAADDETAPVISNIISIIGSSTAQVTWMTDEPATSKVFYSSSTPVDVSASTTLFVEDTTLELSHDLMVSALSADTDYYIVIQSEDAAGNVKTSNEFGVHTSN